MSDAQKQGPADRNTDEAQFETSGRNHNPTALLISGFGSFHTDKDGQKPYTLISMADVRKLVDAPQQVDKARAQWVIPSSLESRVHAEQTKDGQFWALWADVDWKETPPKPMGAVASYVAALTEGADYEVYASRGATEDRQKCRIVIPLGEPLCGRDWIDCQRELNAMLAEAGIEPDAASERPGQLCFLPNRGQWYDTISRRGGAFFDPMTTWAALIADRRRVEAEQAEAVRLEREKAKRRKESLKSSQVGNGAQSLIEVFNQAFHVADILVQAGYAQRGNTFRHPKSETGSFSASVKDGRVHTLSSSDLLFTDAGAHDAFSAFQVLFHQGDLTKALRDAGDNWITIGAESWNQVQRRKFTEDRRAERERVDEPEEDQTESRAKVDYDLSSVPHIEYGLDGFTATGVTIIAGEAGLGKTSSVVPLAAIIAHLVGDPDGLMTLNPVLRRKIVYVTEDSGQVQRLLYGLRQHRSKASEAEFREWFHVVDAKRKDPAELARDIQYWVNAYRYQAGAKLNGFIINPLIVIDTSSASIDLENENDNAEVSRAVSAIKQSINGQGMVWLIAHLAKSITREDVSRLTVRGAGSWMGDANATIFLTQEQNLDGKRFLTLGKKRFEPEYKEIEIRSETFSYHATAPWGQIQHIRYMVCDLIALASNNSRAAQSAKAQAEKYSESIINLLEREYQSTTESGGEWFGMTPTQMEGRGVGKAVNVRQSLAEMTQAGTLNSKTEGYHRTAPTFYWLPTQIRAEYQANKRRRNRDGATTETPEKESHRVL